jgi:hypothetical protein
MRRPSSPDAQVLKTAVLCAVCAWLLFADHGLAWRLGLGELDLPVRVMAIFALLSLLDKLTSSASE